MPATTKAAEGCRTPKAGTCIYCPEIREASWSAPALLALSLRNRRRLVTTAQNRVVQVGRVGFSGVKRYNNPLTFCIYPDVAHSRDAHERFSQFADAFIAILASVAMAIRSSTGSSVLWT